jgi:glyoxalase family protein
MPILGLHHITLITADVRRNAAFYTGVLGLRLIKQTVNYDDPGSYHLYYGNSEGGPGSIVTFFEWPEAPRGRWGIGGTHHLALAVANRDGLLKWKRRLIDLGLPVSGPLDRHYFESIYFQDPDGQILEIATAGPGFAVDEPIASLGSTYQAPPAEMMVRNRDEVAIEARTWPEPVPAITPDMALSQGLHHITAIGADIERTDAFYTDLLGMQRVKKTSNFDDPNSAHWYWGIDNGRPGTLITYFERDPKVVRAAQLGPGQTHHFALAVADEDAQLAYRERLVKAGLRVSGVMDRVYFKSIYTHDPDGHIVEIATAGPGFTADEPLTELGSCLKLPPWLESARDEIERVAPPLPSEDSGR